MAFTSAQVADSFSRDGFVHNSFVSKRRIAMRQVKQFGRIVLTIAAVGCYMACAQEVRGNFLLGTDFSKYHTYRWISIEGGAHPNQVVDAQIKQSVDSQLASKGLTRTDRAKRLVWSETATKSLEPKSNEEENMKNLDQTIAKAFRNYPPR